VNINGRLALITGASSGVGAATAKAIARRGAHVLLVARTKSALEQVIADPETFEISYTVTQVWGASRWFDVVALRKDR
jgi:short-subunit dehydrogenase